MDKSIGLVFCQVKCKVSKGSVKGTAMGKKLTNPPVYFSIVQVRFNPLFKLDGYAADIQDHLRRAGFPDARKEVITQLSVVPTKASEQAPAAMPLTQSSRYKFGTRKSTAEFILDQFALTYQTTEYDVFDSFTEKFLQGLEAVHEVAVLDYVDRVGVRYLNAIKAREGEALGEYFSPQLLGLATSLGGDLVHNYVETRVQKGRCRATNQIYSAEILPLHFLPIFSR